MRTFQNTYMAVQHGCGTGFRETRRLWLQSVARLCDQLICDRNKFFLFRGRFTSLDLLRQLKKRAMSRTLTKTQETDLNGIRRLMHSYTLWKTSFHSLDSTWLSIGHQTQIEAFFIWMRYLCRSGPETCFIITTIFATDL
jgi:hypothetical protein